MEKTINTDTPVFGSASAQRAKGQETTARSAPPEFFKLRPEFEKRQGYSQAVRIGNHLKISGVVSMDADGNVLAEGDMAGQIKNCYADLDKILTQYGYSFNDVVVQNIYTTDMAALAKHSEYRMTIYKEQIPTGTWLEIKGLAIPGALLEIQVEAYKAS